MNFHSRISLVAVQIFAHENIQAKFVAPTTLHLFAYMIIKYNNVTQSQKTQGFCVADFTTLSDERRSRLKIFPLFIWIKEPCVRKFEGLESLKLLGISQTTLIRCKNLWYDLFFGFSLIKISPPTSKMCEWQPALWQHSRVPSTRPVLDSRLGREFTSYFYRLICCASALLQNCSIKGIR